MQSIYKLFYYVDGMRGMDWSPELGEAEYASWFCVNVY